MKNKNRMGIYERMVFALEAQVRHGAILGQITASAVTVDGTTWKDLVDYTGGNKPLKATVMKSIKCTEGGTWAGSIEVRVIDEDGELLYPYAGAEELVSATAEDFSPTIMIPQGIGWKLQFRSTDVADGTGETCTLDYLNIEYY